MSAPRLMLLLLSLVLHVFLRGQTIFTFAGNGTKGYSGDGGPAIAAQVFDPAGVCIDNAGNVYFSDHGNHVVRKVNPSGIISTFAGNGTDGNSGDGGPAANAQLRYPYGLCADGNGNIYIADQTVNVIRKVDANGIITTIAGNGNFRSDGDGGPAINASIYGVGDIDIDKSGNLYLVEFAGNKIRKINTTGIITTVAGTGWGGWMGDGGAATNANLQSPTGIALDGKGNMYIADLGNLKIRKVDVNGIITTFSGTGNQGYSGDGGPAISAKLNFAYGVAADKFGNVYVSDTYNNVVRRVNASGIITTIAGNGTNGYAGDGGPALSAQLSNIGDLCVDQQGNIYLTHGYFRVRKIGDVINCNNSFLKAYSQPNGTTSLRDIVIAPGNTAIAGGYVTDSNNDADYANSVLMKITNTGDKLWEKTERLDGNQWIDHVISLKDGNFLAMGADHYSGGDAIFLMKFDVDGNKLWRRTYRYSFGVNLAINSIKEDAAGNFIAAGTFIEDGLSFHDRYLFLKFDASGALQVSKSFAPPGVMNVVTAMDLVVKGGYSYVAGTYHTYYNLQGALLKIDNSNGTVQWSKFYSFNSGDVRFSQIFAYGNNELVMIGVDNLNNSKTSILVRTDLNGTVLSSKYIRNASYKNPGTAIMDSGGNLLWFNPNYNNISSQNNFSLTKLHPENGIEWGKQYPQPLNNPFVNRTAFGTDSSIFFVGGTVQQPVTIHADVDGFAGRLSRNGNLSCAPGSIETEFGDASSSGTAYSVTGYDKIFTEVTRSSTDMIAVIDKIDTLCYQTGACNLLSLTAARSSCHNDTVYLYIQKTCSSVPDLKYDFKQLQLVSQSDTLVKFKAIGHGEVSIHGEIINDCQSLQDSVHVIIEAAMGFVDLGIDTVICPYNTVALNAGRGYDSYTWQDGSTDSIFIVQKPGLYYVTTADACGHHFSDTILVNAHPPIPINLGANRTKCNSDTLHIDAPAGFLNYTWSNNYAISSTTSQNVVVNPSVDTAYYVKAEKTPGCFAYDTVRVHVNASPPISLGTDKSFCSGDSAMLDAGIGFNQYLWSSGSTAQRITVKTAGTFSVIGITAQGCKSYDTVKVLNVFASPVVSLEHTSFLCTGSSRILDAGTFSSYLWNDGSTSQKIIAKSVGVYAVAVTDNNGCNGNDTARIITMLPLPSNFLPADTVICSYDKLTISPLKLYNAYQWNNNSTVSSITVSQPGTYWLQVKDANGCAGRDSIIVNPKDCMKGCYIPTAFSPNNDGKNDVFQPMLFGNVKKYHFTVYNRWGQLVFETTELSKGWNGTIGGKLQDPNLFVWICAYQFEGEEAKTQKGTVMLVR